MEANNLWGKVLLQKSSATFRVQFNQPSQYFSGHLLLTHGCEITKCYIIVTRKEKGVASSDFFKTLGVP